MSRDRRSPPDDQGSPEESGPAARLAIPSPRGIRGQLQELIVGELLGPAGGEGEEVNESSVRDRYLVGMLAPKDTRVDADEDDDLGAGASEGVEEGKAEHSGVKVGTMIPSSMGLSFVVPAGLEAVQVTGRWGQYERTDSETLETAKGNPAKVWKRSSCGGEPVRVPLADGAIAPQVLDPARPDVRLKGVARTLGDERVVTLFLVNEQIPPETSKDSAWLFQVELAVEGADGSPVFRRRPGPRTHELGDPLLLAEEREMTMLHRRIGEFAVGHGVAVHVDVDSGDPWRAIRITTRAIPEFEVERVDTPKAEDPGFEGLAGLVLDMKALAETKDRDLRAALTPLVDAYETWIAREASRIGDVDERLAEHRKAADDAIAKCRKALGRIRAGIELVAKGGAPAESFRFANHAMYLQRIRSQYAEAKRRGRAVDLADLEADPEAHSWRPFQLAFLLLNLESSTDLHHRDRSHETGAIADLLWFPTGGGKTEAYLGLAAYVMGLRRLQGDLGERCGAKGVAVLMRYTLRLLTLQQFQRASTLICACETIRRGDEGKWGAEPFRIGIWVGQRTTPNWTDQAHAYVENVKGGGRGPQGTLGGSGSPAQLTNCPWCGHAIDEGRHIDVETVAQGRGRTLIFCGDAYGTCAFSRGKSPGEGLPVLVVDEEIYRRLPTLLIATVDKFAQMPWNGRTQMLFGQVNGFCPRHGFRSPDVEDSDSHPKRGRFDRVKTEAHPLLRPPDLIIQDELHLISGPLGSLVGLYETAVDALCSWYVDGQLVRPKVVASTATIRNAAHQVRSLFLRDVEVFPPQGTDIRDNFFSVRRRASDQHPGRLYLGVCAPGKRVKAALIRVYTAYLAAGWKLYQDQVGKHADPWLTLVGYFNSLRELGGMLRLVEDDVASRLKRMDQRGLGRRFPPLELQELTSRRRSTDIPKILDLLEAVFDPVLEQQRKDDSRQNKPPKTSRPLDVLVSTNMISVGVDVQRLGLMVVAGQPKSTAEYIQATSRVGRRHPGIVCTVYNWSRPRDLSHFERFEHYHATFYDQVEALSVTPFASRALDRGLTAMLVSLVRLRGTRFNPESAAADFDRADVLVSEAITAIRARVEAVTRSTRLGDEMEARLKRTVDEWVDRRDRTPTLTYRPASGSAVALLQKPEDRDWELFTCLNSLRDVEPSLGLVLQEDGTTRSSP